MQSFEGIYEKGVVRFTTPVAIPEHAKVKVIADVQAKEKPPLGCPAEELHDVLSRSYDTGETDLAARIDELDP
jgi:hypothetical protein